MKISEKIRQLEENVKLKDKKIRKLKSKLRKISQIATASILTIQEK